MTTPDSMSSSEARLLDTKLSHLAGDISNSQRMLEDVQRKLEPLPALATSMEHIRQDLAKGASTMQKHDERLQRLERDMPGLRELRRWVITGVLAGVGMMGAALFKLVLIDVPRIPAHTARESRPTFYLPPEATYETKARASTARP